MNKQGQTLILMVIIIPVILGIMAIVVDVGVIKYQESKIKNTTKLVIKEKFLKDIDIEEMKKLMVKNEIDVDNLKITMKEEEVRVENKVKVDSVFGSILGFKNYEIKIDIKGYKSKGKITYKTN